MFALEIFHAERMTLLLNSSIYRQEKELTEKKKWQMFKKS